MVGPVEFCKFNDSPNSCDLFNFPVLGTSSLYLRENVSMHWQSLLKRFKGYFMKIILIYLQDYFIAIQLNFSCQRMKVEL